MGHETLGTDSAHYRCVGVGVGPANLSLASLLHGSPAVSNLFLDSKESFGWHDSQQIPGTTLQVSMFKDLVSLTDPTSPFSFLAYLHNQGRVYHFLNAQFDDVPRREFRNYLAWASTRNENVVFGETVEEVDFDGVFTVRTDRRTVTADNVVIGVGSKSWVPPMGRDHLGPTQFHVNDFMTAARDLGGKRVAVIGGGQSGAEAFSNLISRSGAEQPRRVLWISRRRNYFPIDDSPFTNDYYMPSHSDYFYGLDPAARTAFNAQHVLTSDGISESTLREIYQRIYVHRFVDGNPDMIGLHPNREVVGVEPGTAGGWVVGVRHNDEHDVPEQFDADVIVWATGFRPASMDFLAPIAGRLERDGGELRVDEDYAVRWDGPADRSIFVQNGVRGQRGLADPNLSLNAWRSQRIADRIRGVRGDEQLASFIEWSTKAGAADAPWGAR
ncbi:MULTISPECIES: lysine N(6)-hydroxylase/L-ornithine N(5)-oxygenase family protein [unclassified Streptomyces]|uniref:lysine N(6)-hydroxylase/L-ornithine N(5)-oxygenase family protein n=1 Tax=unclassified Streptomyces TaxID=2593676 RepID=UPI0007EC8E14|nr:MULTISPECIES: SidA/IucD/PvdA family monooxygenase [unclassified Streptomyces]MCP3767414.1 SidA/IucD/PvdA family monooxygenase [Streptomyces sp. MAR25Y5]OBQ53624.1 L-lysine 6-monooxygenase [Streptomyces sp. H-KF8]